MFTGLIEELGTVKAIQSGTKSIKLTISAKKVLDDVKLGDSIAVNGTCLTVVSYNENSFTADVMPETVKRTVLVKLTIGDRVNLERTLALGDRFGGHIVSGHVDGLGAITVVREDARSLYFEVTAPVELAKYLAEKGSVTVDGISLTINHLRGNILSLNLIPHTAERTNIGTWQVGTKVNLEVDVLARYIERLLLGDRAAEQKTESNISMAFLAENGFLK